MNGEAAMPRAGTLASSPAGTAASRRRTGKPTFAGSETLAQACHSAAGTPPSQPARRQRSGLQSFLSPAEAGSQILRTLEVPRLKPMGYGSYAGFADGFS
jgi:hypothetical protein